MPDSLVICQEYKKVYEELEIRSTRQNWPPRWDCSSRPTRHRCVFVTWYSGAAVPTLSYRFYRQISVPNIHSSPAAVAGKPVALQTQPRVLWLFHNGGATACKGGSSYPMIRLSKHIGDRIWYLCDSNNDFKVFMKVPALQIYTVLASSLRTDRYGEFAKLSECFFIVMDVWTERELRTLA